MRFCFLDDAYPEAYDAWKQTGGPWLHGTADFWDQALHAHGHESTTLLHNEYGGAIVDRARMLKPDVLCVQNVGRWNPTYCRAMFPGVTLVGFCSYAAAGENLHGWDLVCTSFPWLADALNLDNQRALYLPLAFSPSVISAPVERDIPIAFFGGLGHRIWGKGTNDLAVLAEAVPEFKWWGYKIQSLPESLEKSFQGPAWGRDYWDLLQRTRICVNRHGEIARGFGNNMRQYEAVGCGAMLLTDSLGELNHTEFEWRLYSDSKNIVDAARSAINDEGSNWFSRNQRYMSENHTYRHRAPALIEAIEAITESP